MLLWKSGKRQGAAWPFPIVLILVLLFSCGGAAPAGRDASSSPSPSTGTGSALTTKTPANDAAPVAKDEPTPSTPFQQWRVQLSVFNGVRGSYWGRAVAVDSEGAVKAWEYSGGTVTGSETQETPLMVKTSKLSKETVASLRALLIDPSMNPRGDIIYYAGSDLEGATMTLLVERDGVKTAFSTPEARRFPEGTVRTMTRTIMALTGFEPKLRPPKRGGS